MQSGVSGHPRRGTGTLHAPEVGFRDGKMQDDTL